MQKQKLTMFWLCNGCKLGCMAKTHNETKPRKCIYDVNVCDWRLWEKRDYSKQEGKVEK